MALAAAMGLWRMEDTFRCHGPAERKRHASSFNYLVVFVPPLLPPPPSLSGPGTQSHHTLPGPAPSCVSTYRTD